MERSKDVKLLPARLSRLTQNLSLAPLRVSPSERILSTLHVCGPQLLVEKDSGPRGLWSGQYRALFPRQPVPSLVMGSL
jgi:hypothetical protein